jgi:hypothetical protein
MRNTASFSAQTLLSQGTARTCNVATVPRHFQIMAGFFLAVTARKIEAKGDCLRELDKF